MKNLTFGRTDGRTENTRTFFLESAGIIILISCVVLIDHLLLNGTAVHVTTDTKDQTMLPQFYYIILF